MSEPTRILGILVVLLVAWFGVPGQGLNRVEFALRDVPASVNAGKKFNARLVAKAEEGWHFYSLTRISGGPIATRIEVPVGQPFSLAGDVEAPAPIVDRDTAFGMDVEFYEGEASFSLPLQTRARTATGKRGLRVNIRFQACNREMCLPPRVLTVTAPIAIARTVGGQK
jgi:hypothetical protein